VWLLLACELPKDTGSETLLPPTTPSEPVPETVLSAALVVTDEHTHTLETDWTFASTEVAAAEHLLFSWDGISVDAYDHPHEPTTFSSAVLLHASVPADVLELHIALDDLAPVVLEAWGVAAGGETQLHSSIFEGFLPTVSMLENADESWLFALGDQVGERFDLLAGLMLFPVGTQEGTLVAVPDGSAGLTWQGRFDGPELQTTGGQEGYTVDWSALTRDGYGKPYVPALATELFVGRFDVVNEADDLGDRLPDLRAAASGWWTLPIEGRSSASLSELQGEDGAFPGLEADVVYLVGAMCGTCMGRAPLWSAAIDVH
jgi:hypothetical protein